MHTCARKSSSITNREKGRGDYFLRYFLPKIPQPFFSGATVAPAACGADWVAGGKGATLADESSEFSAASSSPLFAWRAWRTLSTGKPISIKLATYHIHSTTCSQP